MADLTFIIDCPQCRAKVAAPESGRAEAFGTEDESGIPYGERVVIGKCPRCASILVGQSVQLDFEGLDADQDRWSDVTRVFPKPAKAFSSYRIPRVVTDSLLEAERVMQAQAYTAACVMLGRALEAMCQNILDPPAQSSDPFDPLGTSAAPQTPAKKKKFIRLDEGIKSLRAKKVIDDRLYDWSQQLRAFRNVAAHAQDVVISREDAEDLQSFVYAIVEYVYDLADRYEQFQARSARNKTK